jgi:hypothetical protein
MVDAKVDTYEHIVIGTGFVGIEIAKFLDDFGKNFLAIEPGIRGTSAFEFNSVDGVFDPVLAFRTIGLGGGANVWGNGLCLPTVHNFFTDSTPLAWRHLLDEFKPEDIIELVSKHARNTFTNSRGTLRKFRKIFNADNFLFEKHGYAGGTFGGPGWGKSSINQVNQFILENTIINIERDESLGLWKLTTADREGKCRTFHTKILIFAAGTLMNAYLVYLASGISRFPIGNHFSAVIGEIRLKIPKNIDNLLQTWGKNETEFVTVSLPREFRVNRSIPHSAIRFHPITETRIVDRWKELLTNPKLKKSIYLIYESLYFCITRKQFYDRFQIHLLVDVPLSDNNYFEFDPISNAVNITLQHTDESISGSKNLLEQFFSAIAESSLIQDFEIKCFSDDCFDRDKFLMMEWSDTAHYFGTIPVSDDNCHGTVNKFFELNGSKGLFVLGNSSFPTGSHSHPTLLSVLLAKVFCRISLMQRS